MTAPMNPGEKARMTVDMVRVPLSSMLDPHSNRLSSWDSVVCPLCAEDESDRFLVHIDGSSVVREVDEVDGSDRTRVLVSMHCEADHLFFAELRTAYGFSLARAGGDRRVPAELMVDDIME